MITACLLARAVLPLALLAPTAPGLAPPPPAAAPAAAPPPAAAAPAAPPTALGLSRIVGASEQALEALGRMERGTREDGDLQAIAGALPELEEGVARLRARVVDARRAADGERVLVGLERDLVRLELRVADLDGPLTARAEQAQAWQVELAQLRAIWDATAADPALASAPPRAQARVAEVQRRQAEVADEAAAHLRRLVELSDRAADLRLALSAARVTLGEQRRTYERQLFAVESMPLWTALGHGSAAAEARRAGDTLADQAASLRAWFEPAERWPTGLLVFFLAVAGGLWALRRALAGATAPEEVAARPLVRHPLIAALLLALVAAPLFAAGAPPRLVDASLLLAMAPLLALALTSLPGPVAGPVGAVAGLAALHRLILLGPGSTPGARLLLLALCAAGAAHAVRGARTGGWAGALASGRAAAALRVGLWSAAVLLGVAALSNLVGNVSLAARLMLGVFFAGTAGVILAGLRLVLAAALAAGLRSGWGRRRRLVRAQGPLIQRKLATGLRVSVLVAWAVGTAAVFRVLGPAVDLGAAVLGRRLVLGTLAVSLGDVVAFALVLYLAVQLARLVGFVLDEGVLPALPLQRGLPDALSKTVRYALGLLGAVAALNASGIELGKFSLLAGTLGVGIGFGLQNIVNNFISGLILLYERPVQVGDAIEVGALLGEVTRIGIRSSTVRTYQGAEVIVPNAQLIQSQVVNWTHSDPHRRVEIAVGVAYGSDPARVRACLLAAVAGRAEVLERPAPEAVLTGFAESALTFELRFWARWDLWFGVASQVREDVLARLGAAGIAIPFPQRDLHVRSLDAPLPRSLSQDAARNVAVPKER